MNIIYITTTMPIGEKEAFFIPEVKEIIRQGYEILLIPRSPKGKTINKAAESLAKYTRSKDVFCAEFLLTTVLEIINNPVCMFKVFTILFNSKDLSTFIKNLIVLPKGVWIGRNAVKTGADHIHAQWGLTTSTMGMIAAKISQKPWSMTVHRGDIVANNLLKYKIKDAKFTRIISKRSSDLIEEVVNEDVSSRLELIYMGIEKNNYQLFKKTVSTSRIRLICPANLLPVKGHKYLLNALSILIKRGREVELTIAGTGPLLKTLQRQANNLGIDDIVKFIGYIPHNELMILYRKQEFDIVVLPSVDLGGGIHEGVPVSLIEAMSHGIPVVSTSTGSIPELISYDAGFLVPPADAESLADSLELLIKDPELRSRVGMAGKKRVLNDFNVESNMRKLTSLFEKANQIS